MIAACFCREFRMEYIQTIYTQFVNNVLKKMVCMVGMKPLLVNCCNLYTSQHNTEILS